MRLKAAVFSLAVVSLLLIMHGSALASSVSISPLRQELSLKPGETFSSKLQVANFSQAVITVHLSAQSFNITGDNYDYDFATNERAQQWVSFDKSEFTIEPRQVANVAYSLGTPASAEPGERYLAVFASTSDQSAQSITAVDRVGLVLYVDVGGDFTRHGQVSDLALPLFSLGRQLAWSLKLHNSGSAHFHSRLTTWTETAFGHTLSANLSDHLSLPGTVRLFQGKTQTGFWPGLYRLRFKVGQGDDPAYSTTRWTLYFPVWAMIALASLIYGVITQGSKLKSLVWQLLSSKPGPAKLSQVKPKPVVKSKAITKPKAKTKPKPKPKRPS